MADIQRYLNLVTSQHKDRPKYMAWLTASLTKADDAVNVIGAIDSAFDMDSASGSQLDILGAIIGRNRLLSFQPTGGVSPFLDDAHYRILLKAKIAQNQWDGTIPSVHTLWHIIFPQYALSINDNQDMTVDVIVAGAATSIEKDMIQNGLILPKPMGVKMNYSFSANIIFAYETSNAALDGYDTGYWLET